MRQQWGKRLISVDPARVTVLRPFVYKFALLHAPREICEAFIAFQRSQGWVPVRDQYDYGGISGGTLESPALQRLLVDWASARVPAKLLGGIDRPLDPNDRCST